MLNVRHVEERRNAGRLDQSTQSRLLNALMDRLECGLLACGALGELFHANAAARRELDRGSLIRVEGGRVRCVSAQHDAAWQARLTDSAVRSRSSLWSLEGEAQRLMMAFMPVNVDGVESPAAIVMMGRRSICSALGLEMLSSSHGLTLAEQRVLRALVGNSSAREIAATHGVAVATVRTQIQAVRDKLGVRSIDALLLRAAEVPPVTARY